MDIYELQNVVDALENRDRLGTDDIGFLRHLMDNKENPLTVDERHWLQDIVEGLT